MHYAAFVSSSSLSHRPTTSSARSALKVIAQWVTVRAAKMDLEFESCCCRKGKCKEVSEPFSLVHGVLTVSGAVRNSPGSRATPPQTHRHLRRIRREFFNTISHSDVFRTSPSYTMFSRSVASAASVPKRQAATLSPAQREARTTRLLEFRDKAHSQSSLQGKWEAFSALRNEDRKRVDSHDLLTFGSMIMKDPGLQDEVPRDSAEWGRRLDTLVLALKVISSALNPAENGQFKCLEIVAQALQGHGEEAATKLTSFLTHGSTAAKHSRWVLDSFKHVLLSLFLHVSPDRAIEFYLDNYQPLRGHLAKCGSMGRSLHTHFFPALSRIIRAIDSPKSFVAMRGNLWGKRRMSSFGVTMLLLLCRDGRADDALKVYEELRHQNISLFYSVVHSMVRALAKADRFEQAIAVYVSIAPNSSDEAEARSYDSTGLYLFAHQGDVERAEDCFDRLATRGEVLPQEMNLIMHASALKGDTNRATELFDQFFGKGVEGSKANPFKPNAIHYSTLINAHAVRDDIGGMNHWLSRMLADGCTPDRPSYNIVLKGAAQRGDFQSIDALLDQMRDVGVPPNVVSYTTVIKVLARRRDVLGAEAMFKRMLREGVSFDRIAVTTLMNAHVEAGSWRGVIRIFDFISISQLKDVSLGVEVFNTLLKAYVLIGAPLDVVIRIFQRLERSNIKPTKHTFALLIQAACQADRMDIASTFFIKMEDLEKDWTANIEVTKEVLTIIMGAYLRQGNKAQARVVYEDMQSRGIRTTAYTYASILRSYSDAGFEENLCVAQEFLDSLVAQPSDQRTWVEPSYGREDSFAFVYAPLLNAHTKKIDVATAERLHQEFLEQSQQPTIGILALLMDAYRRAGDIAGVQHVWPQIVDLALGRTDEVDKLLHTADVETKFFRSRRRGDLLCIPLSIYIDALSHAGRHIEIAHTWNKLRDGGFQFDAHNWNHLVVALVRAGQPIRAFEIVEKVILPYQIQSQHILQDRTEKVESPLVFDNQETQAEIEGQPFLGKIERSNQKRPALIERLRRRFSGIGRKEPEDLANELHLMQQISPEWNVWRPHSVTMQVLAHVLVRLDSGRLIRPIKPPPSPKLQDTQDGSDAAEGFDEEDIEESYHEMPPSEEEIREAREVLNQILTDYPRTVMKIDIWETKIAQQARKHSRQFVRQTRRELRDL